jgi:hypothetical protein
VTVGQPFAGSLDPARETDLTASPPRPATDRRRRRSFSGGKRASEADDPWGRQVFGPTFMNDIGPITLTGAGVYTLMVEGRVWEAGKIDYELNIDPQGRVVPAELTGTALTLGSLVEGGLATTTETRRLRLHHHRADADPLRLLRRGAAVSTNWTLDRTAGVEAGPSTFYYSDSFENNPGQPAISLVEPAPTGCA